MFFVVLFGYKKFVISMLKNDTMLSLYFKKFRTEELSPGFTMKKDRQIVDTCLCGICVIFWFGFKTKEWLNYMY